MRCYRRRSQRVALALAILVGVAVVVICITVKRRIDPEFVDGELILKVLLEGIIPILTRIGLGGYRDRRSRGHGRLHEGRRRHGVPKVGVEDRAACD
jgi:hypothetical protein